MVVSSRILSAIIIALAMGISTWAVYRWAYDFSAAATVIATVSGTAGLLVILGRARGGITALLVTAALNRFTAEVAGSSIRPEHLAAVIVALALLPDLPRLLRRIDLISGLLLAWLGWMVLGGIVNAPDAADSTRLWIMLLLAAFPYFAIVVTVRTAGRLRFVVNSWLAIATSIGIFGLLSHFLFAVEIDLGIQVNPVTFDPTVAATFREANLFGSAMLMLALTATTLLVFSPRLRPEVFIAALTGLLAIQVSFTRTAWLALLAGLLLLGVLFVLSRSRFPDAIPGVPVVAKSVGLLFATMALATAAIWIPVTTDSSSTRPSSTGIDSPENSGSQATRTADTLEPTLPHLQEGTPTEVLTVPTSTARDPDIGGRVASIGNTADSSIRVRIEFARKGLNDWQDHPIVGQGIGSFGQKYTSTSFDRAWLSNIFVRILHDGGIIGLALFLLPLALLAWRTLKVFWNGPRTRTQVAVIAFGVAITGMLIAFQATEGIQLAWYWCSLGVLAAAVGVSQRQLARGQS